MEETTKSENGEVVDTSAAVSKAPVDAPRNEVSAATIGRMMGLATVSDLKLLDSKVDLLATKISTITVKLDRAITILSGAPTGSDLERIDVQIGSLRSSIKEALEALKSPN